MPSITPNNPNPRPRLPIFLKLSFHEHSPKIAPKIADGAFVRAFVAKGRMQPLLEAMPVHVILNPKTALLGSARYAAVRAGLL